MKAGIKLSMNTLTRTVQKQGLHSQTPHRTPLLIKKHIKSLLEYAKRNLHRPVELWKIKRELSEPMDQCKNVSKSGVRKAGFMTKRTSPWSSTEVGQSCCADVMLLQELAVLIV